MKPIIAHKPHLTARIVISLSLQILLVILLRGPHQDCGLFNLGFLVVPVLAMVSSKTHTASGSANSHVGSSYRSTTLTVSSFPSSATEAAVRMESKHIASETSAHQG
jgi:hypothetical protein